MLSIMQVARLALNVWKRELKRLKINFQDTPFRHAKELI